MRFYLKLCEWICCFDEWQEEYDGARKWRYKIIRIKAWNWFLVDRVTEPDIITDRYTISPVWNWKRFKHLFQRSFGVFLKMKKEGKE